MRTAAGKSSNGSPRAGGASRQIWRARRCSCVRLLAITFTGMFYWWMADGWHDDASQPLLVVGHTSHVVRMRPGSAAKRGHERGISGNEVAHDNAHGAVAQQLASRVVVCGRDGELVTRR